MYCAAAVDQKYLHKIPSWMHHALGKKEEQDQQIVFQRETQYNALVYGTSKKLRRNLKTEWTYAKILLELSTYAICPISQRIIFYLTKYHFTRIYPSSLLFTTIRRGRSVKHHAIRSSYRPVLRIRTEVIRLPIT